MENQLPERKPNRYPEYDYSQCGAYFITICTQDRKKIFWNAVGADIIRPKFISLSPAGIIVEKGILQIPKHYDKIFVDKYAIMPDHIHLILRIDGDMCGRMISAPTISTVVGSLKRWISKQIGEPIWQRSYYDHVIRNQQDYNEVWEYIDNNPMKWLLTKQGEI